MMAKAVVSINFPLLKLARFAKQIPQASLRELHKIVNDFI